MKKIAKVFAFGILILLAAVTSTFAEDTQGMPMDGGGQQGGQGMGGGNQGGGRGSMNHMMGMMNKPLMIATSDGGVVVLNGPKLTKYDKDLKLVNEVEMKHPEPPKNGQGENGGAQNPPSEGSS